MTSPNLPPTPFVALVLGLLAVSPLHAQRAPVDPSHTLGAESCRECHEAIVESWEKSHHATSFGTLANSEGAKAIAKFIGMKSDGITTSASCVRCHYTQETLASAVQTTAGVSCESCHGGASEWIDIHNSKSMARQERVAKASSLGMHHPASVFATAKSCFECHVVDDEQLVNQAGHPAMSEGFELLSWYSGEVKHNFLVSKQGKSVKSTSHDPQDIPAARKRMIFLAGKLLHLSHSLCAVGCSHDAPVTKDGKLITLPNGKPTYAVQHALTIQRLKKEMGELQGKLHIPEYAQALGLMETVQFTTGHGEEMATAAKEIERLAEQFCKNNDGSKFTGLDQALAGLKPHSNMETNTAKVSVAR